MEHVRILELIHQTAPALVVDGDQLTKDFYQHLFSQYPWLQNSFNMANQANGFQARSLFDAIVLFVTKYDQFETLGADAKRIAAKHVSVDVRPEDYGLVGASLLATIQARLGAEATPDVMKAWELAYGRIAGVLIGLETAAYQQQQDQRGGWSGFKPFVVMRMVEETLGVRSFYLAPVDGGELPTYVPGQYISLAVDVPNHGRQIRQYSLSDAPGKPYYRITVNCGPGPTNFPEGLVSNYLHDCVEPGSELDVHAPGGAFCLRPQSTVPLVLLAGGLGITPMMAMLEYLAQTGSTRPVMLIHAVRTYEHQPFRTRLQQLAKHSGLNLFTLYQFEPVGTPEFAAIQPQAPTGLLTADHLEALLTPNWAGAEYYCCGPLPFMRLVHLLLTERGIDNCRYEEFSPTRQVDVPLVLAPEPMAEPVHPMAHLCPHLSQAGRG